MAVGAELAETDKAGRQGSIAFFSKTPSAAEMKYSAFDRELLAIYLAIKHFRHFLEGRKFVVMTDHKPLTFALESGTDRTQRHSRHLSFIAEFTSDIRQNSGVDNVVADMLSRPSISAMQAQPVDLKAMVNVGSYAFMTNMF